MKFLNLLLLLAGVAAGQNRFIVELSPASNELSLEKHRVCALPTFKDFFWECSSRMSFSTLIWQSKMFCFRLIENMILTASSLGLLSRWTLVYCILVPARLLTHRRITKYDLVNTKEIDSYVSQDVPTVANTPGVVAVRPVKLLHTLKYVRTLSSCVAVAESFHKAALLREQLAMLMSRNNLTMGKVPMSWLFVFTSSRWYST